MPMVCAYPGCWNKEKRVNLRPNELTFHRIPIHDPYRLRLWLQSLHLDADAQNLRRLRVCGNHFSRCDFKTVPGCKVRLNKTAVPLNTSSLTEDVLSDAGPTVDVTLDREDLLILDQEDLLVLNHEASSVDENSSSTQPLHLNSQPVSCNSQTNVVRQCAVPTCSNPMEKWNMVSFHPLPLDDPDTLKLWLAVLQQDGQTPIEKLRTADLRVCCDHFSDDDYAPRANKREIKTPAKYPALMNNKGWRTSLKKTAVPKVIPRCQQQCTNKEFETKTTVEKTAPVIRSPPTYLTGKEGPVEKTSSSVPSVFAFGNKLPTSLTLQEDVTVNLACLLQLFRKCGQCGKKTVANVEGDGKSFTVVQRCQNGDHLNFWNSQPQNINETVRQNVNSIQAKVSLGLRIVVKEEVTESRINAAPTREQNLVGRAEEGSDEAENHASLASPWHSVEEEVEKNNEETMEEDDDEEAGQDEILKINEADDEREKGEEADDDEWELENEEEEDNDDEWELDNEEDEKEDEDEWEMDGEEEEGIQKKRGDNTVELKLIAGRTPTTLLGHKILCPDCGFLYSKYSHTCDPNKKHQCPDCDKCFVSQSHMDAHRSTTCRGKSIFPCKFCYEPFETYLEQRNHQRSHPKTQRYLCRECTQTFATQPARNNHVREQHRKKYECPECHKVFRMPNTLARHVMSHSNNKPFKCEVCSRPFAQACQLKCHMRVHTGEKPYKCQYCPKTFNHNVSLKNHIKRGHQGEIQHNPGSLLSLLYNPDPGTDSGEAHNGAERERV